MCLVVNLQFSTALAQGAAFTTLAITNPTPASTDEFGYSVAAVGADGLLIGAPYDDTGAGNAGAAYLFSNNGSLLTTFTNPAPTIGENFGVSIAAVGIERVMIGAPYADLGASDTGVAYLFNTNGVLLTTFTNPTPAANDYFGYSVTAVGNDRVLIGAPFDNKGATDAGVAHLFSTNGVLLITFTNPTPAISDEFGRSVAAVGPDRLLIGAFGDNTGWENAGAAYLFSTNGMLLTTFTNPTPAADFFGVSVAAVGAGRVLIGAFADDAGAESAGAVYLFSTNGTLLTTFTDPTPTTSGYFGFSVTAVGNDRVLIGAPNNSGSGANVAGVAYLFTTNGVLLTVFTNPKPLTGQNFGASVVAVGSDGVLIGTPSDDTELINSGAAYLFRAVAQTPEALSLTIRLTATNTVAVSWPSPSTGWMLQQNTNGVVSVNWSNAAGTIHDNGTNKTLIVNPPTGSQFYRLFKP